METNGKAMRDITVYFDEGSSGENAELLRDILADRFSRGGMSSYGSPEVYINPGGSITIETSLGNYDVNRLAQDLADELGRMASVSID